MTEHLRHVSHWKIVVCYLLMTLYICFIQAQSTDALNFHHISPNDGLSQATVFDIAQDSLGYIWIGTAEGLNKYDGGHFEVFTHDPLDTTSISYDYIRKLHVDHKNTLWVATASGLNRYDPAMHQFSRIGTRGYPGMGLPHDNVSDIVGGTLEGTLWISTRNDQGIISLYNSVQHAFTHYHHAITNTDINRLTLGLDSVLYMAHSNGLITSFDIKDGVFNKIDSLDHDILSITASSTGDVWAGIDYSGIRIYRPSGEVIDLDTHGPRDLQLSNNIPWQIDEDNAGNMWVATDGGLHKIHLDKRQINIYQHDELLENSIINDFLLSVLIDREGRIWAGTSALGLSVHDPSESNFYHVRKAQSSSIGLSSNVIWSFANRSDTSLLVGTGEGLNTYDLNTGRVTTYLHNSLDNNTLSNNRVWSIAPGSHPYEYWLGTSRGLNQMTYIDGQATFRSWQNDVNDPTTISGNSARCLLLSDPSTLWIGTSNDGLNKFDTKSETFTRYVHDPQDRHSISGTGVRCITNMSTGDIWIGTNRGLNVMAEEGVFKSYLSVPNDSLTISDNNVRVILEASDQRIWIGTDRGLNLITSYHHEELKVKRFTTNDGLPNNRIYGIIEDDNNHIWVSTNKGISKLNTSTFKFENYNYNDGLQGNEFNQLAAHKHQHLLFFGGINGFNYFNPNIISSNGSPQNLIFTSLEIEHENIKVNEDGTLSKDLNLIDKVTLQPGERSFAIGFKSLNFSKIQEDQYAYLLDGYDDDWYISGSQNKAVYTNIPPGRYTLKVSTITHGIIGTDSAISKTVVILPYYWETRWFQLAALLLALALAYTLYQWRVRSLVQSKLKLEEGIRLGTLKIKEQNKELEATLGQLKTTQSQMVQQEKLASIGQLTAGIAHEINNPINFIKNSSEALEYDIEDLRPLFDIILNEDHLSPTQLATKITEMKGQLDLPLVLEEINELVQSIKTGSVRTTQIVKSLRYFSHVNENRRELIDIHDPINSSLVILQNSYKERIEIHRQFGKNLSKIKAKPGEINQVILNILNNAIQAIKGKGNIWIKTEQIEGNLTIYIKDDGPGIADNIRSKIFEPFFTTKNVGSGTGLGLAISRGIISEHGGTLAVDNNLPKGATFRISIPLVY